jgi:hypothetical protein
MPTTYDLLGSAEAAKLLEIGPTNFSHLRKKMVDANDESFPAPVATLQCGPIWTRRDMDKFKKSYDARRRRVRPAANGDAATIETTKAPAKASAAKPKAAPKAKPRNTPNDKSATVTTIGSKPKRTLKVKTSA